MDEGWITQWRKGLMEYGVLLVLNRGEGYGYEIVQALQQEQALVVSESTVYPILNRLRAEKFLKVRDVPSAAGPPRRYFSLTALGRARLAEMNAYWKELAESLARLRAHPKGPPDA